MTGISIVTFFLTQTDKIIVSKMLPLSVFAFYTLALTIANSTTLATAPFGATIFPRFSKLIALGQKDELLILYNSTCKLIGNILFPAGLMIVFFTSDVINAWTHNAEIVKGSSKLALFLTIGSICNCLMIIPYQMLLAYGNTKLTFYQNLIAAIVIVPLLFFSIKMYGSLGATFGWLLVNLSYITISLPLIHFKLALGNTYKWYWHVMIIPALKSTILLLILKYVASILFANQHLPLYCLIIIFSFIFATSLISDNEYRQAMMTYLQNIRKRWEIR